MIYHLRICDLPSDERPRERLLEAGSQYLSMAELLAILLNTGSGKLSALGLAQLILRELSEGGADAVGQLRDFSPQRLMAISGVGPAKAATVGAALELGRRVYISRPHDRPIIENPETAHALLQAELGYALQEKFAVLLLDVKNRVLANHIISMGTVDETLAHPRDIFREAIRRNAARVVVAHNHPSGDCTPSPEDLSLTRQILQAGTLLRIPVLDHLVIAGSNFTSLHRKATYLWQEVPQDA
ncbi:RadC family protein [Anthocerotibacter panamensis]|uniref:RadC family protein n=1 Tax=Anthocerotibacter panamensis TaxID=2857077 RepID=UPI001C406CA8|nr:DNA repair protein RadC [Anthocerotibacter panamensis]